MNGPPRPPGRPVASLVVVAAAFLLASLAGHRERSAMRLREAALRPAIVAEGDEGRSASRWPIPVRRRAIAARRVLLDSQAGLMAGGLALGILSARHRARARAGGEVGRARRGRPGPGDVASAISAAWSAFAVVMVLRERWLDPRVAALLAKSWYSLESLTTWDRLVIEARPIPGTIAAAWAYLALTGRWRAPGGPLDQPGRWLGWAWLLSSGGVWALQRVVAPY